MPCAKNIPAERQGPAPAGLAYIVYGYNWPLYPAQYAAMPCVCARTWPVCLLPFPAFFNQAATFLLT